LIRAVLHPQASADLEDATRYYRSKAPGVGEDFLAEFFRCSELIRQNPEAAPVMGAEGVRAKVLQRFPYSIHYVVASDRIRIVAVAHQRRRPGYWRDRLR
jgi:plasmid stabilization system protein ParE